MRHLRYYLIILPIVVALTNCGDNKPSVLENPFIPPIDTNVNPDSIVADFYFQATFDGTIRTWQQGILGATSAQYDACFECPQGFGSTDTLGNSYIPGFQFGIGNTSNNRIFIDFVNLAPDTIDFLTDYVDLIQTGPATFGRLNDTGLVTNSIQTATHNMGVRFRYSDAMGTLWRSDMDTLGTPVDSLQEIRGSNFTVISYDFDVANGAFSTIRVAFNARLYNQLGDSMLVTNGMARSRIITWPK